MIRSMNCSAGFGHHVFRWLAGISWLLAVTIPSAIAADKPAITFQPPDQVKNAGWPVTINVAATGASPLHYQWFKDKVPLADGGKFAGAQTDALGISNPGKLDGGGYQVVVTNSFGSVASRVAILTVNDPAINVHPASQSIEPGRNVIFAVEAGGTGPLAFQWRKDDVPLANGGRISGTTNASLSINSIAAGDQGQYSAVVSNSYGTVTSSVAVLTVNLIAVDTTFNPGASGEVSALALQADGKIVVGGNFYTLGGHPRNCIGRLNVDGTLDTTFNPGAGNSVSALALQADGKIVVGGWFTTLGGQSRKSIGRLNADGTLDESFNIAADGGVSALALQSDGKVVVGGGFATLGGQPRNRIGRLSADGTLDATFNPGASFSVSALALQADGKIVVGGSFTTLGGQSRNYIGRLNADGTLDATFNPGAEWPVFALALQADGKIVVGGSFSILGGQPRNRIGRLNTDGTLDATFNPGAGPSPSYPQVSALALQADGKIVVGGQFTTLGGQPRNRIGRLNADGTLDATFDPGASRTDSNSGSVSALALQADGKIVVGGEFTTLGGEPRQCIGRLYNTNSAAQNVSFDGATITWLRNGPSPEILCASFDYSTNGLVWFPLGDGQRIVGGWHLAGLSIPSISLIRARGSVITGGASSWFNETVIGSPLITKQPGSLIADFGATASFLVSVAGPAPVQYQWHKNGLALNNGGRFAGASSASLAVGNVSRDDSGGYSVVAVNDCGSVTSQVATLTVIDPVITMQPTSQIKDAGLTVTFKVAASGTAPLFFQWHKDGVVLVDDGKISGSASNTLTITNLLKADAGNYQVVVTNLFGSVTSQVASLSVINLTLNTQPASQNKNAGSLAAFTVAASGTAPFWFQWFKDGAVLAEAGKISGSSSNTLTITNLLKADAGNYQVVITNLFGSATSQVASLTVIDPVVTVPPASQTKFAGAFASFEVSAAGTSPLSWQWQKDGVALSDGVKITGSRANSLTVTNLLKADAGNYQVVVTNLFGSVTSQVASLSVINLTLNTQPASQNKNAGSLAAFTVAASGTAPFWFQWFKDGAVLAEAGKISGSASNTLTITNLLKADAGNYQVVITNLFGSVTSQVASLTVNDPVIAMQPASQGGAVGQDITLGITVAGTAPFQYLWYKDGGVVSQTTNDSVVQSLVLKNLTEAVTGSYWVVVSNRYGKATSSTAVVLINLVHAEEAFNPQANGPIDAFLPLPDGKIVVGGEFTRLGGRERNCLGRLNRDGTLDAAFAADTGGGDFPFVYALALQADGKIVVGGNFTQIGGLPRPCLARLEAGGAVDAGFNPGPDGEVYALAIQSDGRILAGGFFNQVRGRPRWSLARLNPDGSLDTAFNPGANGYVFSLVQQPDGKILVGGGFTMLGGQSRSNIGRLNGDGTADSGFNPGASGIVNAIVLQADGRIVAGGEFAALGGLSLGGLSWPFIGRLSASGMVESSFGPRPGNRVTTLAIQADGKILMGGAFTRIGNSQQAYVARLATNGVVDVAFDVKLDNGLYALAVQADGRVLLGGTFTNLGNAGIQYGGRLANAEPATQQLKAAGTNITWLRGGAGPEVWRTAFDQSPDGLAWTPLGAGTRISGGWKLAGSAFSSANLLRARGEVVTGGAGSWFVETILALDKPGLSLGIEWQAGGPAVRVTGAVGQPFALEYAADLPPTNGWQSRSFTLTNSPQWILEEPDTTNVLKRFYRLRY